MKAPIFSPIQVGPHLLKNRLVALPVYTGYAHPDGRVSSLMIRHYSLLAESGVAMVIVANAAVSSNGIASNFNLRIDRDDCIPGFSKLADAIKKRGALACLQLNHAGRFAKTAQPLIPAPMDHKNLKFNIASLKDFMNFFPFEKRFNLTRYFLKQFSTWRHAMSDVDRDAVIDNFGKAASRAVEAGFDMIELHGANGYLLCQFLSSFTNPHIGSQSEKDFKNRAAVPLAIVRRTMQTVPLGYPIGFRLLLREWVPEGMDLPEALLWSQMLEKEGVAYLSATAGTYNSMFSSETMKRMSRPAYLKKDVAELTQSVGMPTIISGRITKPVIANQLICENVCRLIGLGRPLRVDINWVRKAMNGQGKIKTCINCNSCLKRVVLEQGFNCPRWPSGLQERTDLEHALLSRNFKGLLVAADMQDIERFHSALSYFFPDKINLSIDISPTILYLSNETDKVISQSNRDKFAKNVQHTLIHLGFSADALRETIRTAHDSFDKEIHSEIVQGNHGLILTGYNKSHTWRKRLLYKERGKVIGLIGTNDNYTHIMVPVDFSSTTLLVLMFLRQTYMNKTGFHINFIHIYSGPEKFAQQRWKEVKKIVGLEKDIKLQMIPSTGDVSQQLLDITLTESYGTIIMGKKGLSGIKRWLLGSVSAGVFRGLTDQTFFLID